MVRGDYADPNHDGQISHFKALTTALSGTVGVGNIGAVAFAITITMTRTSTNTLLS